MSSADQLSRTVLLLGGDLGISNDEIVLDALMSTVVLLAASDRVINTLAGQVALTTTAMLCVRSGHQVYIQAPDAPLIGCQSPMNGATLHEAILGVAEQIIEGAPIRLSLPPRLADLAFVFGAVEVKLDVDAKRVVSIGWSKWSGKFAEQPGADMINDHEWPMGAMAAAGLAAAEAFKVAGRRLLPLSDHAAEFAASFAPLDRAELSLCSEDTVGTANVGEFDIVSAGAVSNAIVYALSRVPGLRGSGRVFDKDSSEDTNQNRNMLLLPNWLGEPKVDLIANMSPVPIEPIGRHFVREDLASVAPRVLVGVDDVQTRWMLAEAGPDWMGVGATTHFKCLASAHFALSGCVACLHPHDEPQEGAVPTVAFVSFMSGLLVAVDFLRDCAGETLLSGSQQTFLEPFYPATVWKTPVPAIRNCPAGCPASKIK